MDIWVGKPEIEDGPAIFKEISPQTCRLRDLTYSARIFVNVMYRRGRPSCKA